MKLTVYMRVAKGVRGKPKVDARTTPNHKPLMASIGNWNEKALPTAAFALDLDIPDEIFHRAETVLAELELTEDDVRVAAEVADPDGD
jgi:hypothetical protein